MTAKPNDCFSSFHKKEQLSLAKILLIMEIVETGIKDLLIVKPKVFEDDRGYFFESFNEEIFREAGIDARFVQDNESKSMKNVLRGLHFQKPPYAQGKLVRVMRGSVLDVAVDLRKKSASYGQWRSILLTSQEKQMLWIPEGFAHGFVTLEDDTVFFYKCTNLYNKDSEGSIRWNDTDLAIDWGEIENPILSGKDQEAPLFKNFKSPF